MPFARVRGIDLYYDLTGVLPGRPAVLLLHGLGSSSADWTLQVPVFAQAYPVITVDLRGHGRSVDESGPHTIAQMAGDVAALLGQLDPAAAGAHVVGLSLGGCVAQVLAARHPACVRSLVLVNTFARLRPAGLRGAGRMLRRMWLFAFAPMPVLAVAVARGLFPRPEQHAYYEEAVARLSRNSKRPYLAALRAIAGFDLRRELAGLRCPTLVVAGDRDQTVPRAAAEALRRAIPGARLALVPDSGHATPYDQTKMFNRVVLEFIASVA